MFSYRERYHVPLLFYGDVIKDEFRGKNSHNVGSQADVAATILGQLNIRHRISSGAKNLLNPYTRPFAFLAGTMVWVSSITNNVLLLTMLAKWYCTTAALRTRTERTSVLNDAKAYLQTVYQQFIELMKMNFKDIVF